MSMQGALGAQGKPTAPKQRRPDVNDGSSLNIPDRKGKRVGSLELNLEDLEVAGPATGP